ncbi:MAG: hypothetical protein AB7V45_14045 [Candidatus Krumholzibacteriia bacterium]
MRPFRIPLLLPLFLLLSIGSISARPPDRDAPSGGGGSHPDILVGGPLGGFAAAKQGTLYVYGGPGTLDGKFEDADGLPDWQAWSHEDLTAQNKYWHVDDYNCANLDPLTSPNHSWWCGRTYDFDCGTGDFAGYGPDWIQVLEWTGTAPNPGAAVQVTVNAEINHDLEPGYDFLYLGYVDNGTFNIQQTLNGLATGLAFSATFSVDPSAFTGPGNDQVVLRWEFRSDGAWDDEDCQFPSQGAAQIDLIEVLFDGLPHGPVEDCESPLQWYAPQIGVGDFAFIWPGLADLDPCVENPSPQVAFIDDGVVVPGTGGTLCGTWCYGPNGYTINPNGGLMGPQYYLNNQIVSPPLAWPTWGTFNGAMLDFDVWSHLNLGAGNPGVTYLWRVRSTVSSDPADLQTAVWRSGYFYGGLQNYYRYHADLINHLEPGCLWFQVALGVHQNDPLTGGGGPFDAPPAPYFDNVAVRVYDRTGPAMSTSEVKLAQDNFPAIGVIDYVNLGNNAVPFDRAENTAPPPANVPGDELVVTITPSPGAILSNIPIMHYFIHANPLFAPFRTAPEPLPVGDVYGSELYPGGNIWIFDLSDTGLLFPGDVVHYCFVAEEDAGFGPVFSILPADTTGFSDFTTRTGYASSFTMRALPSIRSDGMGWYEHPRTLLWNDYGNLGGEDEWRITLDNLGWIPGQDYDIYYTNSPLSGAGNGLGGRATAAQIQGYETIMYSCGNASSFTITDNVWSPDAGDDIGLLNQWLAFEWKNLLLTGNHLACDLAANYGPAGLAFLGHPDITLVTCDVSPMVGGQQSPAAMPNPGNPVIFNPYCWIAFGGCPTPQTFDQVVLGPTAVSLADFTGPGCSPGMFPGTVAASLAVNPMGYYNKVIYLPYDLMYVYDPMKAPWPSVERTRLLEDILIYFGMIGSTPGESVPDLVLSNASTAAVAPVTLFVLPDGNGDPLTAATVHGGGKMDATITLTLFDGTMTPIFGYPAEDLWLKTDLNGLVLCEGGAVADANTDAAGVTTWSGPLRGGGFTNPGGGEAMLVMVAGSPLAQPGFDIQIHSPDLNGDLTVNLLDFTIFSADWFGPYDVRSDFYWDDVLNLSDGILFVEGGGASCQ